MRKYMSMDSAPLGVRVSGMLFCIAGVLLFALLSGCSLLDGLDGLDNNDNGNAEVCDVTNAALDCDGDGSANMDDVDADDDGLIEIATEAELNNVRYVLDGSGYKSSATADAISTGCPSGGCTGYELTATIALAAPVSPATSNWQPIGSESTPFGAIFEGNGNKITGLTIIVNNADQNSGSL